MIFAFTNPVKMKEQAGAFSENFKHTVFPLIDAGEAFVFSELSEPVFIGGPALIGDCMG